MTPAPHDPLGTTATDDPYKRLVERNALGCYIGGGADALGAPYGVPRRELPPITDADYIKFGREQYIRGYNEGAWDFLKLFLVVAVVLGAVVVAIVLLTR